ncbi:MAG TPA: adenylosuccinate synthase [Anaerolineales bacterium]|nr:adenylosuccinate synthase [Anaerolineae bacterium]HIQ02326.1 adenylosuccinate synthase [Anaerolineales bacterium]
MPAIIVVGAQWGDEGKGRVVDGLAREVHLVARYNGGDNAGHTVVAEGRTLRLHLVPSGVLHPHVTCLIGGGVVVNPAQLVAELDELAAMGVDVGPRRVKLAAAAHIILPTHRALDGARETVRGKRALGTTRRGIGPTYADKAARTGLRAGLMQDPEEFGERVAEAVAAHNRLLQEQYGLTPLPVDEVAAEYCAYARRLEPHLVDGSALVAEMLMAGRTILCEGAQGTLLDLDHGTYPYVTSSSAIAGGALVGLGFGPREVARVIGVAKAYTTRVGEGPFLTELLDEVGGRIREAGGEYGTTTGRPRRCGWLDLTILRYAAEINGLTELALTKLDVLAGIHPLRVAVAYERDGERTTRFPAQFGAEELVRWRPVYVDLPGWTQALEGVRRREDLPPEAQAYVAYVEETVGVPVSLIGVGPDREQTIWSL